MRNMNTRGILIRLVDGTSIKGRTNIGDNKRLSDQINRGSNPFLTVFDVSIQGETGKVLLINKTQIMWAMPTDD